MLYAVVSFVYKGYNQGTIIFDSSHVNGSYKKLQIQVALCVFTVGLWTDVTTFTGSKIKYLHSLQEWALKNIHAT